MNKKSGLLIRRWPADDDDEKTSAPNGESRSEMPTDPFTVGRDEQDFFQFRDSFYSFARRAQIL